MRKREHGVFLRMTTAEINKFKEKLSASGLSQTDFVLSAIADTQITSSELAVEKQNQNRLILNLYTQLRRIGVNINQLAKTANQTGQTTCLAELQYASAELSELRQSIDKLSGSLK